MGRTDEPDEVAHDVGDREVLRREHRRYPQVEQHRRVGLRDDPADDDRHVAGARRTQTVQHVGNQREVRPGQDRQPDQVHILGHRGRDDLRRSQPDPLVDHLEPRVARPDRDLLGAVAVPVEAGLADQHPQPAADLGAGPRHLAPHRREVARCLTRSHRRRDPRRGPELPEHLPQRSGPLPRRQTGAGALQGRGDEVGRARSLGSQPLERSLRPYAPGRVRVALRPPAAHGRHRSLLHVGVDGLDRRAQVGRERARFGRGEPVETDDDLVARLDPAPAGGVRGHQCGLHVAGLDRGDRATEVGHSGHLRPCTLDQLGHLRLDHHRPGEEILVLEEVRLVGQYLLEPQRPLLVPRPRQPERLVPRRQLHRASPGVARQRHAEHLQDDPLHVVLRLGLGQAQRVDLHAVAEPTQLRVGHSVAHRRQLVPELREGAQLAHLLDEPHAGVDEERDPADHLAQVRGVDLARVTHRIEHGDRRRHRIRDLLHRRCARFLQVVAADVDRVPARHLADRVGDHVGDQPQRRAGREHVGPAREVLLDDVVLGRAGQPRDGGALLLGGDLVEREQPHGRRVDRHRGVHPGERDPVEQRPQVADVADRVRRPCPPRRGRADGPGRSRSGWAGRTRPTGRSGPWPGWSGRARCWPRRWSDRRTCA